MNNYIYLGRFECEEMYINIKDGDLDGWSLMGLRPETEEVLRERARECDIRDFYNIPSGLEYYIDNNKWSEDREEYWCESHDVQHQYNVDGVTYYLGFGSGQGFTSFIHNENIIDVESWNKVFGDGVFDEKDVEELLRCVELYNINKKKGYSRFLRWSKNKSEYPPFSDEYMRIE